jgi:hypothetical protein
MMVTIQGKSATTDGQGNFVLTGLMSGVTQISLSKAGYQASTFDHTLHGGDNNISVGLERN